MKRIFIIILICAISLTACHRGSKDKDKGSIDKNVDSITLTENLNKYIEHTGKIVNKNKKLNLTFTFKEGVNIPENPPIVEAKVYLWKDDHLVGIYTKPLYNCYEDYLNPVTLNFYGDGEIFNDYQVAFNATLSKNSAKD